MPTAFNLIRGRGWPGIISEMAQLPYGDGGAVRINDWRVLQMDDWSSAGSKVAAGERDSRHFHPMTFWRCTAASA
jgi:hypothetical protein